MRFHILADLVVNENKKQRVRDSGGDPKIPSSVSHYTISSHALFDLWPTLRAESESPACSTTPPSPSQSAQEVDVTNTHEESMTRNCIFGSTFTALAFASWSASSSAATTCAARTDAETALIEPSVARAITYQRNRSSAETLCYVELPATHNIVIARARGYGNRHQLFKAKLNASSTTSFIRTSNQFLSLPDQLSLGVRLMKLDVQYFASSLRSAHCSELGIAFVDDAAAALLSALGSVLYTSGKDCKTRSHSTISLTRYRCPRGGGHPNWRRSVVQARAVR
ncbi:hypothetical protein PF008_g25489 [Phytophthora fragariae]|uniref:Uncharacterized protein n=1 Tax=Phytophthora fragariae TaxID=53985 RepID=A0A6G0QKL1_9STRA|nr:hypothetical protein PF008_g25489 [Phytophthora fragariae]